MRVFCQWCAGHRNGLRLGGPAAMRLARKSGPSDQRRAEPLALTPRQGGPLVRTATGSPVGAGTTAGGRAGPEVTTLSRAAADRLYKNRCGSLFHPVPQAGRESQELPNPGSDIFIHGLLSNLAASTSPPPARPGPSAASLATSDEIEEVLEAERATRQSRDPPLSLAVATAARRAYRTVWYLKRLIAGPGRRSGGVEFGQWVQILPCGIRHATFVRCRSASGGERPEGSKTACENAEIREESAFL